MNYCRNFCILHNAVKILLRPVLPCKDAAEVGDVLFDRAREDDEVVEVWCATWAHGCAVGVDGHGFIEADGAGVEEAVLYKGGLEFVGEVGGRVHEALA